MVAVELLASTTSDGYFFRLWDGPDDRKDKELFKPSPVVLYIMGCFVPVERMTAEQLLVYGIDVHDFWELTRRVRQLAVYWQPAVLRIERLTAQQFAAYGIYKEEKP